MASARRRGRRFQPIRLPGRTTTSSYRLDCYSLSGQSVQFTLPDEPWNTSRSRARRSDRCRSSRGLMPPTPPPAGQPARRAKPLFERRRAGAHVHRLEAPVTGQQVRFTTSSRKRPSVSSAPTTCTPDASRRAWRASPTGSPRRQHPLPERRGALAFINGRYPPTSDDHGRLPAIPASCARPAPRSGGLAIVHVLIRPTSATRSSLVRGAVNYT